MTSVLIIGCGDIGLRVARLHLQRGDTLHALARSPEGAQRLHAHGITPSLGDLDEPASLQLLNTHNVLVYYLAPPPGEGADPRMAAFIGILHGHAPAKLVYISTSGVYGDCGGAWVNEDTPPNPSTARAKARLAAETMLGDYSRHSGVPVVILRVGGIYGPGRMPIERLQRGEPVVKVEECPYTNRIHADDLARVCVAAAERGKPGAVYNVCDDEHSTMTDYFNACADLLNLPRPPQISLAEAQRILSPGLLSYLNESRRMDNRRMHEELGVTLLYPNLRAGLAACI